jgi:hypothetical protein
VKTKRHPTGSRHHTHGPDNPGLQIEQEEKEFDMLAFIFLVAMIVIFTANKFEHGFSEMVGETIKALW